MKMLILMILLAPLFLRYFFKIFYKLEVSLLLLDSKLMHVCFKNKLSHSINQASMVQETNQETSATQHKVCNYRITFPVIFLSTVLARSRNTRAYDEGEPSKSCDQIKKNNLQAIIFSFLLIMSKFLFQGKSALKKGFGFLKSSVSGKGASQNSGKQLLLSIHMCVYINTLPQ